MSIKTGNLEQELMVLCREVNKNAGRVEVYPVDKPVTDELIFNLKRRSRINMELRYFCVLKSKWETERAEYENLLRLDYVYHRAMTALGGIVEL